MEVKRTGSLWDSASTCFFSSSSDFFFKPKNTSKAAAPFLLSSVAFLSPRQQSYRWMTHADVALAGDILLSRVVACDSEGVVTGQSAHIKLEVVAKFIRFMSHSLVCSKQYKKLKSHSMDRALYPEHC